MAMFTGVSGGGQHTRLGWDSRALFLLPFKYLSSHVLMSVVLCPMGASASDTQVSQPAGHGSVPYFSEQLCFPRAGVS
jgi:hypothetical protein